MNYTFFGGMADGFSGIFPWTDVPLSLWIKHDPEHRGQSGFLANRMQKQGYQLYYLEFLNEAEGEAYYVFSKIDFSSLQIEEDNYIEYD